ncbi:2-keto-4-pentenoate hydratase/2-oxohepta-3-ene-1,7-dioic acid hydratase (catechol pathway) [Sinomicrobium oceani]|uniref:2-keto-4-pentenoate hydratase/2-oxohepta-3-ene-1,7-dioic acid hydratase (Catechol pathway) n=1 Tax=Sinomicrobium oceani TaxID=1150368 RepID=A0A1K1QCF5_9FLAO|nr:fumarylacetoacetate hydrolase family protein [Sinomicrobium oceani]SFW57385.1 2-keto-4-pentenoate hydratase/2-oxohepta-3-ene-1,7-dioic acid hydratase (catechol pathway) [Sinomicrobium oceani]
MRLFRFGPEGEEKPGVELQDGTALDVSAFGQDYDEDFFAGDGVRKLGAWLEQHKDNCPVVEGEFRFGPVVKRPSKLICIGLNYAKHAAESGMDVPKEPVVFFKATSSITGPNDPVIIPRGSEKTDWEVELAVVIGKKASYVNKEEAMDYVAGYALHNDYSERAYQLERGGQWVRGKSCDTFAPLGPYLVTADEKLDPHHLNLWLKVNGETLQNSNTSDFIFDIPTVISHLSEFMTLLPGDVISTGTPAGVGLGFQPPRYLKAGDVVELGIEGLGSSRQEAVAYKAK